MDNYIDPIFIPQPVRTGEMLTASLYDLIKKSRKVQPLDADLGWSMGDTLSQLLQEAGEFSEQVMIKAGKLPHKEPEYDGVYLEAADAIGCIIDAVAKLHPDAPASAVLANLSNAIDKKGDIWVQKVEKAHLDKFPRT
jgi:hypothetical protein